MSTLWEDIKKALKDGYITAAEKTEELTRIGKTKIDIASLKRQIDKKFNQLGGLTFQLVTGKKAIDIARHEEVQKLAQEITQLEKEIKDNERKIEEIKAKERPQGSRRKPSA